MKSDWLTPCEHWAVATSSWNILIFFVLIETRGRPGWQWSDTTTGIFDGSDLILSHYAYSVCPVQSSPVQSSAVVLSVTWRGGVWHNLPLISQPANISAITEAAMTLSLTGPDWECLTDIDTRYVMANCQYVIFINLYYTKAMQCSAVQCKPILKYPHWQFYNRPSPTVNIIVGRKMSGNNNLRPCLVEIESLTLDVSRLSQSVGCGNSSLQIVINLSSQRSLGET